MEKEVLTHERFLCDYKARSQKNLKTLMGPLIVLLCLSVLMLIVTRTDSQNFFRAGKNRVPRIRRIFSQYERCC